MVDENSVPFHHFNKVFFSVFTTKEIQSLSVKEISNPQTFDGLNHPTYGGLYDPALGPQERDDVCSTCGLGSFQCPGHLGHITLPLPVYNPVLFRTMFQLLRGVCFNCSRLLMKPAESKLFQCQIELLNHGLVNESEELRALYSSLAGEVAGGKMTVVLCKLEDFTKSVLNDNKQVQYSSGVKNVTEARQRLVKEFLLGKYFTSTCVHCKMKKRTLRSEINAKIFFTDVAMMAKLTQAMKKKKEAEKRQRLQKLQENAEYDEELEENEEEPLDNEDQIKIKTSHQYLTPVDLKALLRQVWKNDKKLLRTIIGMFNIDEDMTVCPTDVFFLDVVPVLPSRFRPMMKLRDMTVEHQQTYHLSRVLSATWNIREVLAELKTSETKGIEDSADDKVNVTLNAISGNTLKEKLQSAWISLQIYVNCVYDGDADKFLKEHKGKPGVKQILEKKEGLFRKHMMGKRVNYAARSVISPDPYISTDEIGIPEIFAKKLTYPQTVTPWNFQELKQAVINGPEIHPGAIKVENENGQCILLKSKDRTQREAIAKQLLTPSVNNKNMGKPKKVYRHLKNGDVLLMNRQPTLHRPSIQAHKARVLPGQKTLRLHYANCKAYNADFDGDEMNAHFPQNELGRSEAYNLALTSFNYLVPKDGTPLAGLLQDHMVSGVMLLVRGRHFTRADYHQLVFGGLLSHGRKILLVPPCIRKPQVLWSGKQVLTTLLLNIIPPGKIPLNLEGCAKVPDRCWVNGKPRTCRARGSPLVGNDMSESEVVIRQGELLVGVLDKGHYGPASYGLVHCCYELYGPAVAAQLLTGLARLFTEFLHYHGFTLGVEDILVTRKADRKRKKILEEGRLSGNKAAAAAFNISDSSDEVTIQRRFQEAQFSEDPGELKDLDLQMKSQTDIIQNEVVKQIMPLGLFKRFPDNNLQLMVQSGAKGSSVNCMQISCLLGQIELEGRRPPLMLSGKQLPSFQPYDTSPRAGGFVDCRFLTGVRPQEYFYHCMAGREGLIDTAVKTSHSGYLQRCIIKHLEGLVVRYDATVRDCDGSIIQFQYGEDSLDILKIQFLKERQFPFLVSNLKVLGDSRRINEVKEKLGHSKTVSLPPQYDCEPKKVTKIIKTLRKQSLKWQKHHSEGIVLRCSPFLKWCKRHYNEILADFPDTGIDRYGHSPAATEAFHRWSALKTNEERLHLEKKLKFLTQQPDPFQCVLRPYYHFGCTNEKFENIIDGYLKKDPDQLFSSTDGEEKALLFRDMLYMKFLQSAVQPGEAVGLLAAQSIGEPSTQMTLNTFHFAGRGEMNVTLGIPRLREILMTATANLRTPSMDIPLLKTSHAKKKGKLLQQKLTKVYLSQVLEDVEVKEYITLKGKGGKARIYKIRFNFLPHDVYRGEYYLTPARILSYMERMFFSRLSDVIKKHLAELSKSKLLHSSRLQRAKHENEDVELVDSAPQALDDIDDIVDDDLNDDDAAAAKIREKQQEERDYVGEEEEKEVVEEEESDIEVTVLEDIEALPVEEFTGHGHDIGSTDKVKLEKLKIQKKSQKEVKRERVQEALSHMHMGVEYTYDPDTEIWCEMTLSFPLSSKKLDLLQLVRSEAKRAVVTQTPGISRAFLTESRKPTEEGLLRLKTEGVNIQEMYNYQDILDLNQLYTNDIHALARTYGIEAASRAIIQEIRDVFAAYGISVDYRHLSLVADYMTFEGVYKAFNRIGIESNASPLQKMTFETSMSFLKSATIQGASDDLYSPSSRIVVGRLVSGGTGAFEVVQPLTPLK